MGLKKICKFIKKHPAFYCLIFLFEFNGTLLLYNVGGLLALFEENFELWLQFSSGFIVPITILAINYFDDNEEKDNRGTNNN